MIRKSKRSRKRKDNKTAWEIAPGKRGKFGPAAVAELSIGKPVRRMTVIPLNRPVNPPPVSDAVLDQVLHAARIPEQYRSTVKPLIQQAVNAPFVELLTQQPHPRTSGRSVRTPLRGLAKALRKNAEEIDNLDALQYSLLSRGLRGMPLIITAADRNPEFLDGKGYAVLSRDVATAIESGIIGPRRAAHRPKGSVKNQPLTFLIHVLRASIEKLGHGDLSFSCDESGRNCSGPLVDVLSILRSSFPPSVIPTPNKLTRSMLRLAKKS
jgi:hypothetical protein